MKQKGRKRWRCVAVNYEDQLGDTVLWEIGEDKNISTSIMKRLLRRNRFIANILLRKVTGGDGRK